MNASGFEEGKFKESIDSDVAVDSSCSIGDYGTGTLFHEKLFHEKDFNGCNVRVALNKITLDEPYKPTEEDDEIEDEEDCDDEPKQSATRINLGEPYMNPSCDYVEAESPSPPAAAAAAKPAVKKAPKSELATGKTNSEPVGPRACSVCKKSKSRDDYSKNQWKKNESIRKCKDCIVAATATK